MNESPAIKSGPTVAWETIVAPRAAFAALEMPNIAAMSPAKQKQALDVALIAQTYAWVAFPLIALVGIAFSALLLLVANAIGGGRATYGRLFALAANVSIVHYGMAALLIGLLVLELGPDAFTTPRDIVTLLPSLARFAPANAPKLATILAAFNPFQIWSFVLLALGTRAIAGVRVEIATVAAAIVSFGGSAIGATLAR